VCWFSLIWVGVEVGREDWGEQGRRGVVCSRREVSVDEPEARSIVPLPTARPSHTSHRDEARGGPVPLITRRGSWGCTTQHARGRLRTAHTTGGAQHLRDQARPERAHRQGLEAQALLPPADHSSGEQTRSQKKGPAHGEWLGCERRTANCNVLNFSWLTKEGASGVLLLVPNEECRKRP